MPIINTLNSFVNFSIAALVTGGYRADITVTKDSKFYVSTLILLSYLLISWLRSSCLFICSGAETIDLIKSRNLYLTFAMLIALSVSFFISILLKLSSNSNSESDLSFRATYRDNPLIYNRTALSSSSYLFLISSFAIDLNWRLYKSTSFSPRALWANVVR